MEVLCKEFHTTDFKDSFSIGWMDSRHVLICFDLEEDYKLFFLKGIWYFQVYPLRVFKWLPDFQLVA